MEPQIDKSVVNLMKALKQHESGGDYSKPGKSGEYGAYQYTAPTFKQYASTYANMPNARLDSPEDQDKVTYYAIKGMKDKGYTPEQVLSEWNSGDKNAYLENHKGTNKYGVKYDTPGYVNAVKKIAMQQAQVAGVGQQPNVSQETPKGDFLQRTAEGKNILGKIINFFPGQKVGESIGTLAGYLGASKDAKKYYDTSAPTPLQTVGDVAQGALMVAPGIGEAPSVAGRIGKSALAGAGFGAAQKVKEGSTNIGDISKEAVKGGLIGGALGGVSELIGAVANHFPKTMIKGKLEGLTDEEAEKFLKQKIGTGENLMSQAQKTVEDEGSKIDEILQANTPDVTFDYMPGEAPATNTALSKTLEQYPEYTGKEEKLVQKLKSLLQNKSNIGEDRSTLLKYIDKIVKGDASYFEKNQVRKALDKAAQGGYAKLAKALAPNAGHDLAMTFSDALRDEIKTANPETVPMFEELQKSVNIRNALRKLLQKKSPKGLLRYSDIIPFLGGSSLGGPFTGIGTVLANRAVENPALRFAGAKISKGVLGGASDIANSAILKKGLISGNK